jgi:hypothetical protein
LEKALERWGQGFYMSAWSLAEDPVLSLAGIICCIKKARNITWQALN